MRDLLYLVWQEPEDPETETGYWNHYDSLDEATRQANGAEIFTARPRLLGRYKIVTKPVRIKSRKKKK